MGYVFTKLVGWLFHLPRVAVERYIGFVQRENALRKGYIERGLCGMCGEKVEEEGQRYCGTCALDRMAAP